MMSTGEKYIIGIGEVLWDLFPEGKKIGGAPANFAYHVAQFGGQSRVVSAVGNDSLGDEILENLESKGVQMLIDRVAYPTGTVQVHLDRAGIPCYTIAENVAWDNIPFTLQLQQLAQQTCAVCFGSLAQRHIVSRLTINSFLAAMPDGPGQYKIFDINLRQNFYTKEIIYDSLVKCNVLKINDEELVVVDSMFGLGGHDLREKCKVLLWTYRLNILILTCGVNGSYVFTPASESFVETPKVLVADTVGAGDSFTAAFVAALLKKKPVKEAHQLAVKVSAYVCTQQGAMPKLPEYLK